MSDEICVVRTNLSINERVEKMKSIVDAKIKREEEVIDEEMERKIGGDEEVEGGREGRRGEVVSGQINRGMERFVGVRNNEGI